MKKLKLTFAAVILAALTACGGGGDSETNSPVYSNYREAIASFIRQDVNTITFSQIKERATHVCGYFQPAGWNVTVQFFYDGTILSYGGKSTQTKCLF
jgi:hypothetical protein